VTRRGNRRINPDGVTKLFLLTALCLSGLACADPLPLAEFARRPAIADASISPDGRYILYVTALGDEPRVTTLDRLNGDKKHVVLRLGAPSRYEVGWCAWANETRVLCGLHGAAIHSGVAVPKRQLFAVDADGSNPQELMEVAPRPANVPSRFEAAFYPPWYRDRIVDLTPRARDSVLIHALSHRGYPSVRELNVYTGDIADAMRAAIYPPILAFTADARGRVRLGGGFRRNSTRYYYFYRLDGNRSWHPLASYDLFERRAGFTPLHVTKGNTAYALGPDGARLGLWELDLADQSKPRLLSDPNADVSRAIFARDKRLLGLVYEGDKPFGSYVDERAQSVIGTANRSLTDAYNEIIDVGADERVYLICSTSDVDAGSYYVREASDSSGLKRIGKAYPELDAKNLARMQSIEYTARDGTRIPGYVTLPIGRPSNLPVVVMPHDGPMARDSWAFDYLRLFLASRGYVVMQMNYRGSTGYGWEWMHAAHQDWAGVSYEDIADGARWASTQAFTDPKRMCIVGRGFGGYAALVAAMRDAELFKCAIAIGAPTDLGELKNDAKNAYDWRVTAEQIGNGRKIGKAASPADDAEEIAIPVLLIHGTHDWVVWDAHARKLASALKSKRKPHELVLIDHAQHDFKRESERATLLQAVERFLATHLGQS
jgi:dienelactone hydrolase